MNRIKWAHIIAIIIGGGFATFAWWVLVLPKLSEVHIITNIMMHFAVALFAIAAICITYQLSPQTKIFK